MWLVFVRFIERLPGFYIKKTIRGYLVGPFWCLILLLGFFKLRLVNHGFWGNSNGTWTRQYVLHNLHPIYKRHKEKNLSTKSDYYINFDWWTFTTLITRVCFHSILTVSGTVFLFQIRIKCDSTFHDQWFKQNCISIPKNERWSFFSAKQSYVTGKI